MLKGKMSMLGEVSEWFKELVLKLVIPRGTKGSNPFLSAILFYSEFKLHTEDYSSGEEAPPAKGEMYAARGFKSLVLSPRKKALAFCKCFFQ